MAATDANLINLHGSNPQLHYFMTLQISAYTRQRDLYRSSDGYTQVIEIFPRTGLEDQIIRIPIPFLARPDILQHCLFQEFGASSIVQIVSMLVSYAIENWMLHIQADIEFFSDRFLSDTELSELIVAHLESHDSEPARLEEEEEERRLAMAYAIEKLKGDAGFDCDGRYQEGELGTCAVCLEDLSGKLVRMPCSHLYHESCIVPWLERKNSCPMCRRELLAD